MLTFITIAYSQVHKFLSRLKFLSLSWCAVLLSIIFFLTFFPSVTSTFAQGTEQSPSILITEVFYNTPGIDADQEWVELSNLDPDVIDISEYKIGDEEQAQGQEGMLRFPQGSRLLPGEVIVIAQTARGFRALYGYNPDYEIQDSDPLVPDMRRFALWGTGAFALANEGDELLLLDDRGRLVDAINYGDKNTYFDPAISGVYVGQSIERVPAACDTNSAADWQPSRVPTPGEISMDGDCRTAGLPALDDEHFLSIGQIQGSGDVSPFINQQVSFRGVVTGWQEDRNSGGIIFHTLFVQDVPGSEDGDPLTSDGIAVFLGRQAPSHQVGDILQIKGQVTEFYGLTEIDDRYLEIRHLSSSKLPPPSSLLNLPDDGPSQKTLLESKEGMLVSAFEPALVVGPTHSGCGFAVIDAQSGHAPMPRQQASESPTQPLLVLYKSDVDCQALPDLKNGDLISVVSGPLTYHFDQYKIVLQDTTTLELSTAPWPELPQPFQPNADQFTIATFNLNDHFDGTKNMPGSAEPVITAADLAAKQKKLAFALGQSLGCPTIVGLQEIENEHLLLALAAETAAYCGFMYEISHWESSDSRGLDLAYLTDPRRVQLNALTPLPSCTTIDTGIADPDATCTPPESPLFGRPPLRLDLQIDGYPYTLINNHFKSKREGEEETADRRLQQAQHVANHARALLAEDLQAAVIVLGDFNDYEKSPVMRKITRDAGFANALELVPEHERYTYIFDGIPQLIDGILVSEVLLNSIAGVKIIHTNADFPIGLAFDTSTGALPYHASDHDIPLLLIDLPLDDLPLDELPTIAAPRDTPAPTSRPTATTSPPQPSEPPGRRQPIWFIALSTLAFLVIMLFYYWRRNR